MKKCAFDILRALALICAGFALALGVNAVSPSGIPLRPMSFPEDNPPEAADPFDMPPGYLALQDMQDAYATDFADFVDARTPDEYREGHIPGAVNLPVDVFRKGRPESLDQLDPDKPIYVYCEGDECGSSIIVAEQLRLHGFRGVRVFTPGFSVWQQVGNEVAYGH